MLLAVDEAERRGDVARAIDLISRHRHGPDNDDFWRAGRVRRLLQTRLLGPDLPGWGVSRWLKEQAVDHLGLSPRSVRRSLEVAARLRPGSLEDVEDRATILDHDWVFRQQHLYEEGTLAVFLRTVADPRLLDRAVGIHAWPETPMGGYRFTGSTPGETCWTDLATGRLITTPNLGSAWSLVPDECAIGRLVPVADGEIFESVPLRVPEPYAEQVAASPRDWLPILEGALADDPDVHTFVEDWGVLTDVPPAVMHYAIAAALPGSDPFDLDVVAGNWLRLAREAAVARRWSWEPGDLDPWSCLLAGLAEPSIFIRLLPGVGERDVELLIELGEELPAPAAALCAILGDAAQHAA